MTAIEIIQKYIEEAPRYFGLINPAPLLEIIEQAKQVEEASIQVRKIEGIHEYLKQEHELL